jgi:hypothetical protein
MTWSDLKSAFARFIDFIDVFKEPEKPQPLQTVPPNATVRADDERVGDMVRCSVCGQPPRSFILLRCDNCGTLSCFSCARKEKNELGTTLHCGACESNQVRDTLATNWDDFANLRRPIRWRTASGEEVHTVFEADVGVEHWSVRMNDFPDEPMYTLIVDGREIVHFDDWPAFWGERPAYSK